MSLLGYSPAQRAFFAGRYGEVLSLTIDSPRGGSDAQDTAFVVGALAFTGRMTEAELLMEQVRRRADAGDTLAAAACFLSIEHNRAARPDVGRRALLRAAGETRGRRSAWGRAFLHQGIAAHHFFTARYERAGRSARRALANAQEAQFPYAQLLANDMLGHVYLRTGRFREGLRLLERLRRQARELGLASNAHAIEIAVAVQRARLSGQSRAIADLEELRGREDAQDTYSRRSILLELATRLAWGGQLARARACLDDAAPLCAGDARAQAALWCARGHVARLVEGPAGVRRCARRAREALPDGADAAREVELLSLAHDAAHATGDDDEIARVRERLRVIDDETGLYVARATRFLHGVLDAPAFVPDELDEVTPLLRDTLTLGRVDVALREELLGLVPRALGLTPGRRLYVTDAQVLVEDNGEMSLLPALSPRARQLLRVLSRGPVERAALLREVWGLRNYDPFRHDSVIKTSVSRLRHSLGRFSGWLQTSMQGYHLDDGVEVRWLSEGEAQAATSAQAERAPIRDATRAEARRQARHERILALLAQRGATSVSDVARAIGATVRTASRDLTDLARMQRLVRAGAGRGTTYRVNDVENLSPERPARSRVVENEESHP